MSLLATKIILENAMNKIDTGGLKVLLYDIETTPNLSYVWGQWEQNVIAHKEEGKLLCYAYKWLGEKKTYAVGLNTKKYHALVSSLHDLFSEADIIIAHNGDQFDIKMSNRFFLKEGLKPPHQYKTIDTKKLAKSKFKFNSNKLNDLGEYLELGKKINTGGFELWQGCMSGDRQSWKKMLAYNVQDVVLLEKVYLTLRPWCKHPNLNAMNGYNKCSVCQSNHVQHRGFGMNSSGKYQRFQCMSCGKWMHGTSEKTGTILK